MNENNFILVSSTNFLLLCKCKSDIFHLNLSKSTRILYWSSVERSTVEADVTYIKKEH